MTTAEFEELLAILWGRHGGQRAAARHFGVADRTVRRWIAGVSPIPNSVARELTRLVSQHPLPPVMRPPGGTLPGDSREGACTLALRAAVSAVTSSARVAGWSGPEIAAALRALADRADEAD